MPLLHIAWFRFKDGVAADRIERHLAACRALPNQVPVVRDLQCGPNTSNRAGGLTHGIVVTLPDAAALPDYLEHPAHVPVANALVADIAELRVMDLAV
jgi:hypothetical protein